MNFIETYWFVWLLSMVLFGGLVIRSQAMRMRNIVNGNLSDAFNGMGFVVVFIALAYGSAALLFLSLILNVITYAKM